MRLEFGGGTLRPSENIKGVLTLAFPIICQRLGVDRIDEAVRIEFVKRFNPEEYSENAAKNPENLECAACADIRARYPFIIKCSQGKVWRLLADFTHEMIHIADLAKGDLKFHWAEGTISYRGIKITAGQQNHARENGLECLLMPFERTAYSEQHPLAAAAYKALPDAARKFVKDSCKTGSPLERWKDTHKNYTDTLKALRGIVESKGIPMESIHANKNLIQWLEKRIKTAPVADARG